MKCDIVVARLSRLGGKPTKRGAWRRGWPNSVDLLIRPASGIKQHRSRIALQLIALTSEDCCRLSVQALCGVLAFHKHFDEGSCTHPWLKISPASIEKHINLLAGP